MDGILELIDHAVEAGAAARLRCCGNFEPPGMGKTTQIAGL